MTFSHTPHPVALITGSGRRIGAVIAENLHQAGYRVVIHYRQSQQEALVLANSLNIRQPHSAITVAADLDNFSELGPLIEAAQKFWGRLDVLINNASTFFSTLCGQTTESDWERIINSNLKAPYFLSQLAAPHLSAHQGVIINIADIHGQRPLKGYPVYSIAKAGLIMLTQALARELAPNIRVNAVAPGATLLSPVTASNANLTAKLIEATALKRFASPQDIAQAVLFLIQQNSITGQIINVDCGRSLRQ